MTQLNLNSYKTIKDNIIHQGIISKISENVVTVSLKGNVNCEGCKAQSACGVSDSNDKEIEVINSTQSFEINEPVDVLLKKELDIFTFNDFLQHYYPMERCSFSNVLVGHSFDSLIIVYSAFI